ncbi:MAG TPA: CHRD domain-containing protein [Usitatibacter sp.]|jgi:hypothetical protein|nr:CHRD domain-containing protein [Usitatibacter sp.]
MKAHPFSILATAAVLSIAGCSSMHGMMHSAGSQHVMLAGANEVPPNQSSASGSGTVTINSDRSVSADITVEGMNATAAHIHEAGQGKNGKVIVPLTKVGDNHFTAPAGAKLSEEQYEAYKAGNLYVNVHSKDHPGGEIRAQLAAR